MNKSALTGCLCLALLLFSLAGCTPVQPGTSGTPFFRPPTSVAYQPPTSTPAPTVLPGPGGPTPTPTCTDNLTFISDVTIPDDTYVEPNATLDKRWEVENSGNCNWNEQYRMRLVAGPDMGAQVEQALFPARSGTRAVLRIVFKAPIEPGSYRSAWQAISPGGEPFGDPFFIVINVKGEE